MVRVLVVEDFEPFRRLITSTLQKRADLQVVSEVSDGLEAVQKAEELRPDLIILDIGLPGLNGIDAARRIRKISPESKILFLTQESYAAAVEEAFNLGARGYVFKANAGFELLAAIEAVLQGNEFISERLRRSPGLTSLGPASEPARARLARGHEVQFYSDDASFVAGFARFIEPALRSGNAAIVVATETHRSRIVQQLHGHGFDAGAAIEKGSFQSLDVSEVLSRVMVNDSPDPGRFMALVRDLLSCAAKATRKERPLVAICGECTSTLWAQGKADAALKIEQLCSQLTKQCYEVDILCGFPLSYFSNKEDSEIFRQMCAEHSSADSY
jgi:DNA-binding NarL/FixJ family response regulator